MENFEAEVFIVIFQDKNSELEALFEAGVNLVKSGDQEAQSAAEKVDTLHQQMQKIHRVIEFRIQLSLVYLSFHKKVQQVSCLSLMFCCLFDFVVVTDKTIVLAFIKISFIKMA